MRLIARSEAISLGLKRYFTGKPCCSGHLCERYVAKWQCVDCKTEMDARYREEAGDTILARRAKYRESNRETLRQKDREFYEQNREARRAAMREYGQKNSAAAVARASAWNKAHPESKKASVRNRRARAKASGGVHTAADIAELLEAQKGRCAYCAKPLKGRHHVDHIMPIALGGGNAKDNLQLLCAPCNQSKGAKHPIAFAQQRGLLL